MAAPMPLLPPVMRAVLPERGPDIVVVGGGLAEMLKLL